MLTASCKYTLSVGQLKSTSGEISIPFQTSFYTPFQPLWGNPDMVLLDLRALVNGVTEEAVVVYMYLAGKQIWRDIQRTGLWPVPDVTKSLDELLADGYPEEAAAAIECYVRWASQYMLLTTYMPYLAMSGNAEKVLGDFTIRHRGNLGDLKSALDSMIKPNMEACYHTLVGEFTHKGQPRVVTRASDPVARDKHLKARGNMPPGFGGGRNWDGW